MAYEVLIERSALRALAKIAQPHRDRVASAIHRLGVEPRPSGAKKLSGRVAWRIRVGDFRILYEIHDGRLVVLVIDVGHRREVYR